MEPLLGSGICSRTWHVSFGRHRWVAKAVPTIERGGGLGFERGLEVAELLAQLGFRTGSPGERAPVTSSSPSGSGTWRCSTSDLVALWEVERLQWLRQTAFWVAECLSRSMTPSREQGFSSEYGFERSYGILTTGEVATLISRSSLGSR